MSTKKLLGQYYTCGNPFTFKAFHNWVKLIPECCLKHIAEPFAGANNIVKLVSEAGYNFRWLCYDIDPSQDNNAPQFQITKLDTIENFPKQINTVITNPPYLAKNSASKMKLEYKYNEWDDLYKKCLDVILTNCDYAAAIIPESFITANIFHDRLYATVSIVTKMFEDTDCPVCLALFIPTNQKIYANLSDNDFLLFRNDIFIGNYDQLISKLFADNIIKWKFNIVETASIGIHCVDNQIEESIRFCDISEIDLNKIKVSSRNNTIVSGLPENINKKTFINECNKILTQYRKDTEDIFLTSFKGLRKDNKYRRRLDFNIASIIMNKAIENINGKRTMELW